MRIRQKKIIAPPDTFKLNFFGNNSLQKLIMTCFLQRTSISSLPPCENLK